MSANASTGELDFELAYDSTPGLRERESLQQYLRDEPPSFVPARRVYVAASMALIEAIGGSPHRDRLVRAVEALRPVAIAQQLEDSGRGIEQLAAEWGYREGAGYMTRPQFVEAEARKRLPETRNAGPV